MWPAEFKNYATTWFWNVRVKRYVRLKNLKNFTRKHCVFLKVWLNPPVTDYIVHFLTGTMYFCKIFQILESVRSLCYNNYIMKFDSGLSSSAAVLQISERLDNPNIISETKEAYFLFVGMDKQKTCYKTYFLYIDIRMLPCIWLAI